MIQGCYINHPGSILGTSIFRDFHGPGPKVPVSQGFRSSASNGVDTIGKSAKNYGGYCRLCFVLWISWGDIMGQRGSRKPYSFALPNSKATYSSSRVRTYHKSLGDASGGDEYVFITIAYNVSSTIHYQTEISRARARQRSPCHRFVWDGRLGLGSFTGITLRAEALYSSCSTSYWGRR